MRDPTPIMLGLPSWSPFQDKVCKHNEPGRQITDVKGVPQIEHIDDDKSQNMNT